MTGPKSTSSPSAPKSKISKKTCSRTFRDPKSIHSPRSQPIAEVHHNDTIYVRSGHNGKQAYPRNTIFLAPSDFAVDTHDILQPLGIEAPEKIRLLFEQEGHKLKLQMPEVTKQMGSQPPSFTLRLRSGEREMDINVVCRPAERKGSSSYKLVFEKPIHDSLFLLPSCMNSAPIILMYRPDETLTKPRGCTSQ